MEKAIELEIDRWLDVGKFVQKGITGGDLLAVGSDHHVADVSALGGAGVGEAQRALHIAGAVDFDDPEAGMLLVVSAQTAVVWTATLARAAVGKRNRARFVNRAWDTLLPA
jgi:hypothetical protein